MSLNAKGDKPEPPVEQRLADLERQLKKTRGANRRRAFALLRDADEKRALTVVEEMVEAASGKARAELGALLASTGIERFVERALRGKWGDAAIAAAAPVHVLHEFIARLETGYTRVSPADIERRARALGLAPLDARLALKPGSPGARALVKMLDDELLPRAARLTAARALARVEPWALWGRRDELPIELGIAAGLAAGVAVPSVADGVRFAAAVRAMTDGDRSDTVALAKLPASALRLPRDARVPLLALVLDDTQGPPDDKEAAGKALAELMLPEADEAILARPAAAPTATVAACARIDAEEARAVLAPLLRHHAELRIALANNAALARHEAFLGDAVALLATDPLVAASLLAQCNDTRARAELLDAVEHASATDARALVCGVMWTPLSPSARATAEDPRATLGDILAGAGRVVAARIALLRDVLERLRRKPGVVTLEVDAALDVLRRR